MNFIELLKQGKVKPDEIDDYIDKWHNEYSGSDTLEDYLGMTEQQYNEWWIILIPLIPCMDVKGSVKSSWPRNLLKLPRNFWNKPCF